MKLTIDHHIHSRYSFCCGEDYDLSDIITLQLRNGMEYACVSDHIHSPADNAGLEEHHLRLQELTEEPGRLLEEMDVRIGAELTIVSQEGDLPVDPLSLTHSPDFIIGGCHYIPWNNRLTMGDIPGSIRELSAMNSKKLDALISMHREMIIQAVSGGRIDILAHPFDFFFRCGFFDLRLLDGLPRILVACADSETAVEINNTSVMRCSAEREAEDIPSATLLSPAVFLREMLEIIKESRVLVSPGSDAHSLQSIGELSEVERVLEESGIPIDRLFRLNTVPAAASAPASVCRESDN